jgi:hypothetical protein
MGFARGRLVADVDAYAPFAFADGACPLVWRQGLKHDAAGVMELADGPDGRPVNGLGELIDVEPQHVYPLLKGTDLSRPGPVAPRRSVILTQQRVGDDTGRLRHEAPRLWAYLEAHADAFTRRKSSIYRGRPPFAMFGVGPYCFAPFKVAVSGLHKTPVFHAVGSVVALGLETPPKPVMCDDTCYFLAAHSPEQAALLAALLNEPGSTGLLRALALPGAKRPVTKSLLQRLDLAALLGRADHSALLARAGGDVRRLAGRDPDWPDRIETLLTPGPNQADAPPGPRSRPNRKPGRSADGLRHD